MKKVITFMLACAMAATMAACAKVENVDSGDTSMFVQVEKAAYWRVYYHKESKVMYVVSRDDNGVCSFTMLVNADGSPMVYKEKDIPHVGP